MAGLRKLFGRALYLVFALVVIAVAVGAGLWLKQLIDTTAGQSGVGP